MADSSAKIPDSPKDRENPLKRKRESDQETELESDDKEVEGVKSPPAKIQAKSSVSHPGSPPAAERRASLDESNDDNAGDTAASSSREDGQKQELEGQGNEEENGVEKMQ